MGIILPQVIAFIFIVSTIISGLHVLGIWSCGDTLIVLAWINLLALTFVFGIGTLFS
jgi:hypothetical protein